MAKIKVSSTALNSKVFYLHEAGSDGKPNTRTVTRQDNKIINVIDNPPSKVVTILGRHQYSQQNQGFISPYAITEIEAKDWEHIQTEYKHDCDIKLGLIFAGKNEGETLARSVDSEQQNRENGTELLTEKTLASSSMPLKASNVIASNGM